MATNVVIFVDANHNGVFYLGNHEAKAYCRDNGGAPYEIEFTALKLNADGTFDYVYWAHGDIIEGYRQTLKMVPEHWRTYVDQASEI